MNPDWRQIRSQFPALERWTFLNTASFGQLPKCATQAVARHFARRDQFACEDFIQWFDDADGIRASIARLIHCAPEDIAFITNACSAFSLLLGGLEWKAGDRIITLEDEFPNHYYYPAFLSRAGVELVEVPYARLCDHVTPRTRLVAVSTVNYSTGFRLPLLELADFLRSRGVLLYLDGTQSIGALEFDVASVHPDMLAVHGYKWLLAPTGAGFLYVSPSLRERLQPNVIGWRSHREWRRYEYLHHGAPEFKPDAEKYEGGMLSFPTIYAMGASVEMMLDIGPRVIEQRVLALADAVRFILLRRGAVLASDQQPCFHSPIVTGRFEGKDAPQMARELKARGVLVAARRGNLRVSPHFYNNENDLDILDEVLRKALGQGSSPASNYGTTPGSNLLPPQSAAAAECTGFRRPRALCRRSYRARTIDPAAPRQRIRDRPGGI